MENIDLEKRELTNCYCKYCQTRGIGWSTPLPPQGPGRSTEWIKLLSFGSHPHKTHTLKFSKTEADTYIPRFHSAGARIARLFKGICVMDEMQQYFGTMNKMEVRFQGVWAMIKWHEAGKKLLREEPTLFFTPIWILCEDEDTRGLLVPTKLLKIVLTREPYPFDPNLKPKRKRAIKYKSITNHLLGENHPLHDNRKQFMALIHAHMQKTGQDFSASWSSVKQNNPQLYENSF